MQSLVRGYKAALEARYFRAVSNNAPTALCLIAKFNKLECEEFNDTLTSCLQALGFSTVTLWLKPEVVRLAPKPTKLQELNSQLALDWLIERHVNSSSRWLVGVSLASTLAINTIIRRPEITNYLLIAPTIGYSNLGSIKLLTRLSSSGAAILAEEDAVSPVSAFCQLISFAKTLEARAIEFIIIKRANHFFENKLNVATAAIATFYTKVLIK